VNSDRDRRQERRFDKVFAVYLCGAWGTSFGIARNISEGGMFIETPDPYPLSSRMRITFSPLKGNAEMTVVGEVIHLCFLDQTAATQNAASARRRVMVGMGVRFVQFEKEREVPAIQVERAFMQ